MIPLPGNYCAPIGAQSASLTVYAASILFHAGLALGRLKRYYYTIIFLDVRDRICYSNPNAGGV